MMVGITSSLMVLARREFFQPHGYWFHYRGAGTVRNVFPPAYLFAVLLNGPAMLPFLHRHFTALDVEGTDLSCLPAVAVLWFLVGWGLDRRSAKLPPMGPRWLRLTLSGSAFVLVFLFLLVFSNHLWFEGGLALNSYSRHGLWASGIDSFIYMPWLFAFMVYFGYRFWTTLFQRGSLVATESTNQ